MMRCLSFAVSTLFAFFLTSSAQAQGTKEIPATRQAFIEAVVAQIDPLFPNYSGSFADNRLSGRIFFSELGEEAKLKPYVDENLKAAQDVFLSVRFQTEFLKIVQNLSGAQLERTTPPSRLGDIPQGKLKRALDAAAAEVRFVDPVSNFYSNWGVILDRIGADRKTGLTTFVSKALEYPLLKKLYGQWVSDRIKDSFSTGLDLLTVKQNFLGDAKWSELETEVQEEWLRAWLKNPSGFIFKGLADFASLKNLFSVSSALTGGQIDDLVEMWIALHQRALLQGWINLAEYSYGQKNAFDAEIKTGWGTVFQAKVKRAVSKNPALLKFLIGVPVEQTKNKNLVRRFKIADWFLERLHKDVELASVSSLEFDFDHSPHAWLIDLLLQIGPNQQLIYDDLNPNHKSILTQELFEIFQFRTGQFEVRLKMIELILNINSFLPVELRVDPGAMLSQALVTANPRAITQVEKDLLVSLLLEFKFRHDKAHETLLQDFISETKKTSMQHFLSDCGRLMAGIWTSK